MKCQTVGELKKELEKYSDDLIIHCTGVDFAQDFIESLFINVLFVPKRVAQVPPKGNQPAWRDYPEHLLLNGDTE